MATTKRAWLLALALAGCACVSVTEPVLTDDSVSAGQRTVVLVYPAPGPWVITESESKAESAAKTLPGLSFVVQSFQDDRFKKASADLQRYLPAWQPADQLEPLLMQELPRSGFAGRFMTAAQADLRPSAVQDWNRAADVLDWQDRYIHPGPNKPYPRDYSRVPALADAVVLEVDLLPYLAADDDGNMSPSLTATTRLVRCGTGELLWRHEDTVSDPAGARSLYEFKTLPQQLLDKWQGLMPALAAKISAGLASARRTGRPDQPARQ